MVTFFLFLRAGTATLLWYTDRNVSVSPGIKTILVVQSLYLRIKVHIPQSKVSTNVLLASVMIPVKFHLNFSAATRRINHKEEKQLIVDSSLAAQDECSLAVKSVSVNLIAPHIRSACYRFMFHQQSTQQLPVFLFYLYAEQA